jgi:hypothetical protein
MTDKLNRSQNAVEMQAVVTLKAARDVAETIETLRRALRETPDHWRRRRLKDDLLEAAERLCNLLDLLISWLSMVPQTIRDPLNEGIHELRGKLLSVGMKLVGDRAQRIIDQAEGIATQREELPLGVPLHLGEALAMLNTTVDVLGGPEAMPQDVLIRIDEAARLIARLKDLEGHTGFMKEIERS